MYETDFLLESIFIVGWLIFIYNRTIGAKRTPYRWWAILTAIPLTIMIFITSELERTWAEFMAVSMFFFFFYFVAHGVIWGMNSHKVPKHPGDYLP